MRVERDRASWTSVAPVERRSGVSAKRRAAFAAVFLSLRRHDPDQVRRVAAPHLLGPAASQPPVGAPLGLGNYPQTIPGASRLRFDDGESRAAGRPATRNAALLLQNLVKYD